MNDIVKRRRGAFIAAAVVIALLLAMLAGFWAGRRGSMKAVQASPSSRSSDIAYWYDPMVPGQHFNKPGKSPFMDMQLVPRRTGTNPSAGVRVDANTRANLGLRTALVKVGAGTDSTINAAGTLQWDLRGERRISSRVEGYVDQVFVLAPFEHVRAGQPLVSIVAPRLASALAEYRALASSASADARATTAAARARLRVLGLVDGDSGASRDGVPRVLLRAATDGVLAEINVRGGDNVAPGQVLFRLNATDPLWMEARMPPGSQASVTSGQAVTIHVASFPGEVFSGHVDALLPQVDVQSRAQALRIVIDNHDGRLAAGMIAEANLVTTAGAARPRVPSEALILTGTDARVIVETDEGFVPVHVVPGRSASGSTEILEGLKGGERVLVSGQFLIDSEASLSGGLQRLQDAANAQPADPSNPQRATPP